MRTGLLVGLVWLLGASGLGCAGDAATGRSQVAGESQPCPEDSPHVDFVATVLDCTLLGEFSGTAYRAAVDPRFVLTMRLEGDCAGLGWSKGQTVHVAIHSPTELFAPEEHLNRRFVFRLYRHPEDGRGYWLEVIS